jgi:hypothetical protein
MIKKITKYLNGMDAETAAKAWDKALSHHAP